MKTGDEMNIFIGIVIMGMLLTGCSESQSIGIIGGADGPTSIYVTDGDENIMYEQIGQEEAKKIIDSGEEYVLLDVREQNEFDEGHIPGAILIPHEKITDMAEDVIPEKDTQILVYCRSGRRSKIASADLVKLGYTNVKEFGGIIDWQYEIEK